MNPFTLILISLVIAAIGAYVTAFGSATKFWGQKLGGIATDEELYQQKISQGVSDAEARGYLAGKSLSDNVGYQQAITPSSVNFMMLLFILGNLSILALGTVFFRWYVGVLALPGTWIAMGIIRNLFPGPSNPFYREKIVSALVNRHNALLRSGDALKTSMIGLLLSMFDNFEIDGKIKGPQPWQQ